MVVLVTYKNKEEQIKIKGARVVTRYQSSDPILSFFLSILVRSYMSITPESASLEILIK